MKFQLSVCCSAFCAAAMLLERVAADVEADSHLRNHARELVGILERDPQAAPPPGRTERRSPSGIGIA